MLSTDICKSFNAPHTHTHTHIKRSTDALCKTTNRKLFTDCILNTHFRDGAVLLKRSYKNLLHPYNCCSLHYSTFAFNYDYLSSATRQQRQPFPRFPFLFPQVFLPSVVHWKSDCDGKSERKKIKKKTPPRRIASDIRVRCLCDMLSFSLCCECFFRTALAIWHIFYEHNDKTYKHTHTHIQR